MKLSSEWLSPNIAALFNLSVENGTYPCIFKTARVTPIFKNKGSRQSMDNYRPISVICNLSKVFEKLINDRLNRFFVSQCLLSQNQFGFRKNSNTELAVINLMNKILPVLQDKLYAFCIFLDFTSCFDTVNRRILMRKLERYGVRGLSLDFLRSYFEDRKHFVVFGDIESIVIDQEIGVIQGSKNGTFIHDVYSNDLNSICEGANIIFADDTCLFYSGGNLPELTNSVNEKLKLISSWCAFNRLAINPAKSEFMLITRKKVDIVPVIHIGDDEIRHRSSVKYLGLVIDENMKFSSHAMTLKGKLSFFAGVSYSLSRYFDVSSAKKYYYAFVYSSLTYAITVWGGILHSTRFGELLLKLQKKIVNNLFGVHSSSNCIFKEFRILKIHDIHRLNVASYMFKNLKLNTCPSLNNCINLNYPQHYYSTRQRNMAILPIPDTKSLRICFNYQYTDIWNKIPDYIKNCDKLGRFKVALIECLIGKY